jgi:general secretion pathway protein F
MPIFEYKATDASGKDVKRTIEADSLKSASQQLKRSGYFITSIKEASVRGKSGSKSSINIGGKVPLHEMTLMIRQLSSLLKASIPLVEALNALVDQVEHERLRSVLSKVNDKVKEGSSFAAALRDHPKVFNEIFVNMVEAGEQSGALAMVLVRLADFMEAQVKLRSKVTSSMMYPVIMVGVGVIILAIIFTVALPKIIKVFESQKMKLPLLTEILIGITNFINQHGLVLLGLITVAIVFFFKWKKSKSGKPKWDRIVLSFPIFGKIIRMINISRFSSTLNTLITGGVPLLPSLGIVRNLITNTQIQGAIDDARRNIKEGESIAEPLKKSGEFPPLVTHMIAIGEKTGELEEMLDTISASYGEQVDTQLNRLTGLLEPVMIISMGISVAIIVFAIVMPLLELNRIR